MTPPANDEFDVRVLSGEALKVVVDVCAQVGGGCPVVTELEDYFSDLRNKGAMAVRRRRRLLSTKEGFEGGGESGGHRGWCGHRMVWLRSRVRLVAATVAVAVGGVCKKQAVLYSEMSLSFRSANVR